MLIASGTKDPFCGRRVAVSQSAGGLPAHRDSVCQQSPGSRRLHLRQPHGSPEGEGLLSSFTGGETEAQRGRQMTTGPELDHQLGASAPTTCPRPQTRAKLPSPGMGLGSVLVPMGAPGWGHKDFPATSMLAGKHEEVL